MTNEQPTDIMFSLPGEKPHREFIHVWRKLTSFVATNIGRDLARFHILTALKQLDGEPMATYPEPPKG